VRLRRDGGLLWPFSDAPILSGKDIETLERHMSVIEGSALETGSSRNKAVYDKLRQMDISSSVAGYAGALSNLSGVMSLYGLDILKAEIQLEALMASPSTYSE